MAFHFQKSKLKFLPWPIGHWLVGLPSPILWPYIPTSPSNSWILELLAVFTWLPSYQLFPFQHCSSPTVASGWLLLTFQNVAEVLNSSEVFPAPPPKFSAPTILFCSLLFFSLPTLATTWNELSVHHCESMFDVFLCLLSWKIEAISIPLLLPAPKQGLVQRSGSNICWVNKRGREVVN
jgi:hypothetical protein